MPDSRVLSLPIVIRFDVLKDTGFCHSPRRVSFAVNQFDFQRVEKALHRSVVIAIGSAAHAATQTIIFDQSLISF